MNLDRHVYRIHIVVLLVMTLYSMEGSFVSEEHHGFHLQGRSESSWGKWVSIWKGWGENGSCMTAVTIQRQEWGRGGRVLCGPLGKVVKDDSKRD
jgi:hypothetical protein